MRLLNLYALSLLLMALPTYGQAANMKLQKQTFQSLTGWQQDDQRQALHAFRKSCPPILNAARYRNKIGKSAQAKGFVQACRALQKYPKNPTRLEARRFFEQYFEPYRILSSGSRQILTGYYEPELEGSWQRSARYPVTVYKKPDDLVMIRGPKLKRLARRSRLDSRLSWAQKAGGRLKPYATREEIEQGYLSRRGLELLYLSDPVDAFYMHVQGSARVKMENGESIRIGFAAKNGYPFGSVERKVIRLGLVPRNQASQKQIQAWLRRHPRQARKLFWVNKSYIFFRKIGHISAQDGPIGAQGISLTAGRSLAVDNRYHKMGTPIWVVGKNRASRFGKAMRRLMIAQDVGSAIKGPERGDIFWGSGDRAGTVASHTYLKSDFIVFLPRKTRPVTSIKRTENQVADNRS